MAKIKHLVEFFRNLVEIFSDNSSDYTFFEFYSWDKPDKRMGLLEDEIVTSSLIEKINRSPPKIWKETIKNGVHYLTTDLDGIDIQLRRTDTVNPGYSFENSGSRTITDELWVLNDDKKNILGSAQGKSITDTYLSLKERVRAYKNESIAEVKDRLLKECPSHAVL